MEQALAADNFVLGQLVKSKTGRDKGTYYFVCGKSQDGARLLLADGRKRPMEKPKIKNCRHVQMVHYVAPRLQEKLAQQKTVTNEEIRLSFKELPKDNGQCVDKEVSENV
ncbi:MAG: KOW domain-containing protein [Peptococcaceae bacterium]|jgi:ribosomal protein L14E/L6E/L27E|nr:KOW domain-containing protein [Peptococcaceae bacterium]